MKFLPKKSLFAASVLVLGVAWAQFSTNQTPEALRAEIAAQVAQGVALEAVLAAAQAAGVDVAAFATAAFAAGVPVASITTVVLTKAADPTAALATLGQVFASNPQALTAVFTAAITVPSATLSVQAVASAIEAGSGANSLPAAVVTAAVASGPAASTPAAQPARVFHHLHRQQWRRVWRQSADFPDQLSRWAWRLPTRAPGIPDTGGRNAWAWR